MRKVFLQLVNATLPPLIGLALVIVPVLHSNAQQHVIAQKDNTRPETTANDSKPAFITSLNAMRWNGYNEIQWTTTLQEDTRRFIVEYSRNGVDFQTAGEMLADKTLYTLKHQVLDDGPMLYRIRSEQLNGKNFYTPGVLLDGVDILPIRIYPTVVTGNTVNIVADWPIERIVVTATDGKQVFVKEVGGQTDYMSVVVPGLSKGMYFMTFYGRGWKTTSKFVI